MSSIVKLIRFLLQTAKGLRFSGLMLFLIIVASVVSGLAGAGFVAVINSVLNQSADDPSEWLLGTFVALCLILPISRFLSNYLLVLLSNRSILELRMQLCRQILAAPLRRLEELGAPRLLASLTQDVGTIVGAIANTPRLLMNLAVVSGCLVYLAWLSLPVFGLTLLAVVLGVLSYQLPILKAQGEFRRVRECSDALFGHFQGLTEGTKELKMHRPRREAFETEVEGTSEQIMQHSIRGSLVYDAANAWGQVLFYILIGLILFLIPRVQELGREALTGYVLAILYMITPLDVILQQLPNLGRASIAINKVRKLGFELEEAGPDIAREQVLPESTWHRLEVQGLTHSYYREREEETFVLGPIDLVFKPGEVIFLVGGNGSGKTTLAKLLIGLYTPEGGRIVLDGEAITDETIDDYRQLFSVVFTDFFLFTELIGLGRSEIDERARRYLEALHLDHKVEIRDGALSTVDLSQGQRKRLALLTAYLEDRAIYLFDEWAADQDPQFKEIFYRQLLPDLKRRGKTVFVISHDDHYYGVADRIIKLDYGKVEVDGGIEDYRTAVGQPSIAALPAADSSREVVS